MATMISKRDQTSGRRGEEEKKKSEAGTNGGMRKTKRRRSSRKQKKEEKRGKKRRGARDGYSKRQYYAESRSYGTRRKKLATVRIDRPISGAQQQQQQQRRRQQDAGVQKCRRWWRHPTSPGVVDPKMSLLRDSLTTSRNGANLDHTTIGAVPKYGISLGQQALSLVSIILFLSTPPLVYLPLQNNTGNKKTRKCSKQLFGGIARKFDQDARRSLAALRPDLEGFGWFLGGRIARLGRQQQQLGKVGGAAEDSMHFSPACR
ncbi:hypothetical protein ASPTUDRAFT_52118 [Aspergillus tubingensis CBS 134.48]|uniref:Uncharacterized protein n=1 Tax=Aspergillus tubingensis (strain CBS 134.48) TaxID=767770 RepID=A0A1L9NLM5_ASPTC|nr:hypothetical protein ASPTUDRAFT_52118 [Aspergillus tubingensis CBS 134.48]